MQMAQHSSCTYQEQTVNNPYPEYCDKPEALSEALDILIDAYCSSVTGLPIQHCLLSECFCEGLQRFGLCSGFALFPFARQSRAWVRAVLLDTLIVGTVVDSLLFAFALVFSTAIATALAFPMTSAVAFAVAVASAFGFVLAYAYTR